MKTYICGIVVITSVLGAACAGPSVEQTGAHDKALQQKVEVRSLKQQTETLFDLNVMRVDRLLLPAMRKAGIDCWITMSREANIDPVFDYIMDGEAEGGHRNAYIFADNGSDRLTRIMIGTHLPRGKSRIWDRILPYPRTYGEKGPSLQPVLTEVINELKPKKIGINESVTIPICDGLSVQMKKHLIDAIGPLYASRLVSAEQLIVDFLDTPLPEEMPIFIEAAKITEALAAEVLSNKAIQPGKTTIGDLNWHAREWVRAMKCQTWWPISVSIYRRGAKGLDDTTVIQPGDIVHTDLGIVYSGLYTDYQRNGYVLKPGETEPPAGLKMAMANNNKVHELLARVATPGKPGYQVKQEAEALCKASGLTCNIGVHSLRGFGHGIGAWFNAAWLDRNSVRTTFPVRLGTYYAIEFSTSTAIPEWGGEMLRMGVEESGYAGDSGLNYFIPLQQQYYLIKSDS
jgi:hypothetical protein